MSGFLPSIIYPGTVRDEQARLGAALAGTNASVVGCVALDAPTRISWGLFYAAAVAFTKEDPGIWGLGTMMDRAQSYEAELVAWQSKLSLTCKLGVPVFDPNPPSGVDKTIQYVAWAAGIIAGAYVVAQIIPLIPKKR